MATFPALTDTYVTQGNVPFPDVSTALVINQFNNWATKAFLLNQLTGGTTVGTRHANSVWTCLGSSDGVTAALDGTDRWTTTFTPSKLIGAVSGTAHSWIALRNASAGYDIVFDLNAASPIASGGWYAVKSSTGLTGGSTTARPVSASGTEDWMLGTAGVATSSNSTIWGDNTTSTPHYLTFTTGSTGKRWYLSGHRSGPGLAHTFAAFWEGIGAHASDTRNQWWIKGTSAAGRGAPLGSQITGSPSGCTRRTHTNAVPSSGAGGRTWQYSSATPSNAGPDVGSGDYISTAIEIASMTPGSAFHYGVWADLYFVTGGTVGGSYPSTGAMERHIIGDVVAPCNVAMVL